MSSAYPAPGQTFIPALPLCPYTDGWEGSIRQRFARIAGFVVLFTELFDDEGRPSGQLLASVGGKEDDDELSRYWDKYRVADAHEALQLTAPGMISFTRPRGMRRVNRYVGVERGGATRFLPQFQQTWSPPVDTPTDSPTPVNDPAGDARLRLDPATLAPFVTRPSGSVPDERGSE